MKRIIGYFAMAMAMALTACGSDDEILNEAQRGDIHPLLFTATVEDIQTRVTNDTWTDGDVIGVKISTNLNAIGEYALNADGTVKEVIKGVNWQGTEPATVTAWYPLEDQNLYIADQSNGLQGMNLLKAKLENQTYEEGKTLQLVFKHQMAKVR
ncbi:fimbrillin family protein, partial [Parabacteroides distasonis]